MIHAVIFDLDGTLIHSLPGLTSSLNRVLSKHGHDTQPEETVRTFIGDGVWKLVERALSRPASNLEEMIREVSEDYNLTWQDETAPYPGVIDALAQLTSAQIPMAVVSNKPDRFCRAITDALFPETHFHTVVGQRENVPTKPDPASSLQAAELLGVPPGEIAFLGDSTIDLITARNANMIAVAATWGYHDPPALAAQDKDHSIDDISEFPALIL